MPPANTAVSPKQALLGDPRLRQELLAMVRRRVPADRAEDVVQTILVDAFASEQAPATLEEFRRWLWGIARHKIADDHRKRRREPSEELSDFEGENGGAPEANDLLRWAERELPEGQNAQQTLEWLLREGEGEKLEHIAASENLPAPRVRQRVTRLRQHFRARWQAQLVAVATLVGAGVLLWWWLRPTPVPEAPIVRDVPPAVSSEFRPVFTKGPPSTKDSAFPAASTPPTPSVSASASASAVPSASVAPPPPAPKKSTPTSTGTPPSKPPGKTPFGKDSSFDSYKK